MAGPRESLGDCFGVKNEVPDSDSGGLDRKLDPNEDRGPEGTFGGIVLSGVWVIEGLGSGFCSIFLGKSSGGDPVGTGLDDCSASSVRRGSLDTGGFGALLVLEGTLSAFGPLGGWNGGAVTAGDTGLVGFDCTVGGFSEGVTAGADGGGP